MLSSPRNRGSLYQPSHSFARHYVFESASQVSAGSFLLHLLQCAKCQSTISVRGIAWDHDRQSSSQRVGLQSGCRSRLGMGRCRSRGSNACTHTVCLEWRGTTDRPAGERNGQYAIHRRSWMPTRLCLCAQVRYQPDSRGRLWAPLPCDLGCDGSFGCSDRRHNASDSIAIRFWRRHLESDRFSPRLYLPRFHNERPPKDSGAMLFPIQRKS